MGPGAKRSSKPMQVKTQGQLRVWARPLDGSYKELPRLTTRFVKRHVEDLLLPAEIVDTWQCLPFQDYWRSRPLQLSLLRT